MKSKRVAIMLALFLGFFGSHQFYLGHKRRGFTYLGAFLLSVAFIIYGVGIIGIFAMAVIILIDVFNLLATKDSDFHKKYNSPKTNNDQQHLAA